MGLGRFRPEREKQFVEKRKEVLSNYSSEFVADNPFLFSSRIIMQNMLVRIELFDMIQDVPGAIIECGVAHGNSLMEFAYLSSIKEPYAINRKIIGFDTFDGFTSLAPFERAKGLSEKDFSECSDIPIVTAVELYDMDRPMYHMPRVELIKGDAVQTIPEYTSLHPELTVAMLYLDFDIYEPTKEAITNLLPLIPKGGIVVFDEFNYEHFAGETKALKDIIPIKNIRLKKFKYDALKAYFVVE